MYELSMILRPATKPELVNILKKVCTSLLEQQNVIMGMENMGERKLPYPINAHGEKFHHGRYGFVCVGGVFGEGASDSLPVTIIQ